MTDCMQDLDWFQRASAAEEEVAEIGRDKG